MINKFKKNKIQKVWEKGDSIPGYKPSRVRKDQCGARIERHEYGNRDSKYGWEIDHINPGGSDNLSNLRPLQWENNVATSDGRLTCKVKN